eukprot:gb/GECG01011741.1/.p1 GENE.gb/GECG01011741.1/~~gb/GECG01011741.1/.p1  ORF type:complete len:526 (+),score=75.28 gb/GECG01011741.1/:1-1578(+)
MRHVVQAVKHGRHRMHSRYPLGTLTAPLQHSTRICETQRLSRVFDRPFAGRSMGEEDQLEQQEERAQNKEEAVAQSFFNMLDVNQSGAIESDDLVRISQTLKEPLSKDAAEFAVDSITDEAAIDYEHFLQVWAALPVGENNRGPPDDPILDPDELKQWKKIQDLMSRFIFLYARASNPEMASVTTFEEGSFPGAEWRMRFAIASASALGPDTVALDQTPENNHTLITEAPRVDDVSLEKLQNLKEENVLPEIETIPPTQSRRFADSLGLGVSSQQEEDRLEEALKEQYLNASSAHNEAVSGNKVPWMKRRLYYVTKENQELTTDISPWHDIPLMNNDGTFNAVIEIPKWSRAKLECATNEPFNPFKHDTKKGKLRNYEWGDLSWNYGFLPQTWEDPQIQDHLTGYNGDGDPVDIVEIGQRCWPVGTVVRTKVLGAFAMVDEGETDWKVICLNVVDPMAHQINDIDDVEVHMPGCLAAIRRWFRLYKLPNVNEFALQGLAQSRERTIDILRETHRQWHQGLLDRDA